MKILIEVPSWLGDAVMITPAIETLLSQFDKPEITLVGSFGSVELLKNHPRVIRVTFLKKNFFSLFKTAINLGNFDVYFSFRTSLLAMFFK